METKQPEKNDKTEILAQPTQDSDKSSRTRLIVVLVLILILVPLITVLTVWLALRNKKPAAPITNNTAANTENANQVTSLRLDPNKNYGNKYANGILPVGDNKYDMSAAKQGYVYLCHRPNPNGGGASTRGPWFINNNTEYDLNKKVSVQGNVKWQGSYNMNVSGDKRIITTNDLPSDHTTGTFPVSPSDPAYKYDRNPNSIAAQSLSYELAAVPTIQAQPNCVGGESGVMTIGVALFDAFDAGGRDAGAWEVQDGCDGHPQNTHEYHYHTLSKCIADTGVNSVIGFALDGFPITGPKVGDNNILTSSDLDECHGITSEITIDGKKATMYHYVMTQDFPYSISCFRGTATEAPGRDMP